MIIRRVDSISLGKVLGVLYAVIGLFGGGMFALLSLAGVGIAAGQPGGNQQLAAFAGFGLIMVILMPLIYGAFGFVGGIILALLYNATASITGGIEIETDAYHSVSDE